MMTREPMRARLAMLAAALVLVSTFAPALSLALTAPAAAQTGASGPPAGMVGVSSTNIDDVRPTAVKKTAQVTAGDLSGAVYVSNHAATTEVDIVTGLQARAVGNGASVAEIAGDDLGLAASGRDPAFALVITDDVNHEGRSVAIDAAKLRSTLGFVPSQLTVRNNETGEEYTAPTTTRDGWVVADLEHFSSNSVTFTSEVDINANPAQNGDTWTYNVNDLDAVSNVSFIAEGVQTTERETVGGNSLSNGDTYALNVAGTHAATNVDVTLTGRGSSTDRLVSGTHSADATDALNVGGNMEPTGPATNNEPQVTVTNINRPIDYPPYTEDYWYSDAGANSTQTVDVSNVSTIKEWTAVDVDGNGSPTEVTVYFDGKKMKTWNHPGGDPETNYTFSSNYDVSGQTSMDVTLKSTNGWTAHMDQIVLRSPVPDVSATTDDGKSVSFGNTEGSKAINLTTSTNDISWSYVGDGSFDYELNWTEKTRTKDPAADVDGDGTNDITYSGILSPGSTTSTTLSDLPVGAGPGSVSLTGGNVDVSVTMTERTRTQDLTFDVNENSTTHASTLSPGSTTTMTVPDSSVKEGTNTVNVTVADTLSADAPTPSVGMTYNHTANSTYAVDYAAEELSVRYDVNKTFGSDRSSASLTIPFENEVYSIRDVERKDNGGTWSSVSSTNYDLTASNDLVVDLGTVTAGDSVAIRANASRVRTHNMSVTVTDPTVEGNALDSGIRIDSIGAGANFEVSGADADERLRYASGESWNDAHPYVTVESNGEQTMYLPNAPSGGEFRLTSHNTKVMPESNEVKVEMVDAANEPRFKVMPGATEGDTVTYKYYNTRTGENYVLWSVSRELLVDSAEANSPVLLTDDDDDAETLEIYEENTSTSSTSGDGGGSDLPAPIQGAKETTSGLGTPLLVIVAVALSAGLYVVSRRLPGPTGRRSRRIFLGITLGPLWLITLELIGVPILSAPLAYSRDVWPALALGAGGIVLLYVYRRWVKGADTPQKVQNVSLNIRGDSGGKN